MMELLISEVEYYGSSILRDNDGERIIFDKKQNGVDGLKNKNQ